MMIETGLLIAGCAIFVVLGTIHAAYTLATNKFDARDARLTEDMKRISPVLTRHTTMWNAWVGFNLSHSLGAILFGLFYIILTLENYAYLKSSVALNTLLVGVPLIFLALALKYWFSIPRNGILVGTMLIGTSLALRLIA
jgi:hypothetical protein